MRKSLLEVAKVTCNKAAQMAFLRRKEAEVLYRAARIAISRWQQ